MICELCNQENPVTCDHPKNGYCALFPDKKKFKTLADLQIGDTFRYKGSDENDWHTVSSLDDEKLYYPGFLTDKPQSNYRTNNVQVICK